MARHRSKVLIRELFWSCTQIDVVVQTTFPPDLALPAYYPPTPPPVGNVVWGNDPGFPGVIYIAPAILPRSRLGLRSWTFTYLRSARQARPVGNVPSRLPRFGC